MLYPRGGNKGRSGEKVPHIRIICCVSLLLTSSLASAASVRLQVEGLSGELQKKRARAAFNH